MQNDPERQAVINEYLDRRVKTASKADAQLRLAAWCDQNGLKDQAVADYNEVIRLDPSHRPRGGTLATRSKAASGSSPKRPRPRRRRPSGRG